MNTATHTPTPWRNLDRVVEGKNAFGGYSTICRTTGQTPEHADGNAAFIVRACNAHDVLTAEVSELKSVAESLRAEIEDLRAQGRRAFNNERANEARLLAQRGELVLALRGLVNADGRRLSDQAYAILVDDARAALAKAGA